MAHVTTKTVVYINNYNLSSLLWFNWVKNIMRVTNGFYYSKGYKHHLHVLYLSLDICIFLRKLGDVNKSSSNSQNTMCSIAREMFICSCASRSCAINLSMSTFRLSLSNSASSKVSLRTCAKSLGLWSLMGMSTTTNGTKYFRSHLQATSDCAPP